MKQFIFGLALFLIGMIGWFVAGPQGLWAPWLILVPIGIIVMDHANLPKKNVKPSHPNGLITKEFDLPDVMDDNPSIKCSIEVGQEFCFKAKGYGDCCSQDGQGSSIVIENKSGVLTLYVYNDIDEEEPIIISLERTKESNRI